MHRSTRSIALAAVVAVIPASAANAGTVALDKPCYVPQQTMVATGAAFTPGAPLTLGGDTVFPPATADPAGAFQVPLTAPLTGKAGARPTDVVTQTLTVTDTVDPAQNASVPYQVANFAVDRGASRNPRSVRKWYFSGFPTGKAIYGHFRFKGKTASNYRFGTAAGPCGLLSKRAPGIPGRVRTGTWTLQVDTRKTYSATTVPALRGTISVFLVRK
jgi:hypothetical protein